MTYVGQLHISELHKLPKLASLGETICKHYITEQSVCEAFRNFRNVLERKVSECFAKDVHKFWRYSCEEETEKE